MGGGLLQLAAYGSENHYLMGDPQITFFKAVYKQHTNFAIEAIEVPLEGGHSVSDSYTSPTMLRVTIPRHGDLLSNLFLKVRLPDIISSVYRKFRWVDNLGEVMVRSATILIGGQQVDRVTSEWLNVYHRLNLSQEKRKLYDAMIGNSADLNHPDMSNDAFTTLLKQHLLDGTTPSSATLQDYLGKKTASQDDLPDAIRNVIGLLDSITTFRQSNTPYYNPDDVIKTDKPLLPSIRGRTLYIPLPFWFQKDIGLAVPLIALQNHDIEVQIEFSPIVHLFTVLDWNASAKRSLRQRPNALRENHQLGYYVYHPSHIQASTKVDRGVINDNIVEETEDGTVGPSHAQLSTEEAIQNTYNDQTFAFDITLEAFYVFLEDNERELFAKNPHEYLIEQVSVQTEEGFHGDASQMEMQLYNPVKELIWVLKRDDAANYNVWFNYTNWIEGTDTQLGNLVPNPYYQQPDEATAFYQPEKVTESILTEAKIQFNGVDRFSTKDQVFFSYVQPYLYHTSNEKGIYVYSFALEPEKYQPSGSVNMSMIQTVHLDFSTTVPPVDPEVAMVLNGKQGSQAVGHIHGKYGLSSSGCPTHVTDREIFQYTYGCDVFVVGYNLLKIIGGMAGLAYTS